MKYSMQTYLFNGRSQALTLAVALVCLLAAWAAPEPPPERRVIRVRLLASHNPSSLTIRSRGGTLSLFVGQHEEPIAQLDPGEAVTISSRGSELNVNLPEMGLHALSLRIRPEEEAQSVVQVAEGQPLEQPLPYEGQLVVEPEPGTDQLRLVNHVSLEDYVASVLSSEYGLDDREGTKAMAVAVRTYALRSHSKFGKEYDHSDQVLSQRYEGALRLTDRSLAATRATRGEVLTYNGKLIDAVYFSSSGGHTADNEDVWDGEAVPYLRGKEDPYDEVSPHSSWRQRISRPQLLELLSSYYESPIRGFVIHDHSSDGRVSSIELLRSNGSKHRVTSNQFRLLVNRHFGHSTLKSTFFDASRSGNYYVFEGKGYGHGVGLSQWGAHGQALEGRSYEEILSYYYTGASLTTLDRLNGTPSPDPPVAAASPPADTPSPEEPEPSPPPEPSAESSPVEDAPTGTAEQEASPDAPRPATPLQDTTSTPPRRFGW